MMRRADNGIPGGDELRVGQLLPQQGRLRLGPPKLGLGLSHVLFACAGNGQIERLLTGRELGLGLGHVLLARTGDGQVQRFLIHHQLGLGHVEGCLDGVKIILAQGPRRQQGLGPVVALPSVEEVGLRRFDVRPGLGNFFGAAAVTQPFDDLALGRHLGACLGDFFGAAAVAQPLDHLALGSGLGLGLSHLRLQATRVQPGQNLAPPHAIAFLNEHGGNPLAVVKGQLRLS